MFFFCVYGIKQIDKFRLHGWLTWKSPDSLKNKYISDQRAILRHRSLGAGLSVSSKLFVFECCKERLFFPGK